MTETLVLNALQQAIHARQPPVGLIHHSDRGGQYAGTSIGPCFGAARCVKA